MLTSDDQRARIALIQTHARLSDGRNWTKGRSYRPTGLFSGHERRCMTGEIGHQLGLEVERSGVPPQPGDQLFKSIRRWFMDVLKLKPETYNDLTPHREVLAFLEGRIADLERELHIVAPKPEAQPRASRSLVTAVLGIFG